MKKTILLITAAKNAVKTTASDLGKKIFTVASGIKKFLIKFSLNLKLVLPIIILITINITACDAVCVNTHKQTQQIISI